VKTTETETTNLTVEEGGKRGLAPQDKLRFMCLLIFKCKECKQLQY